MSEIIIREIEVRDNEIIANLIRQVLVELGAPKVGTAYEDEALKSLSEVYLAPKAVYYVFEEYGKILGGAGIAPLENAEATVCELQKMYFLPEARGKGYGAMLMQKCLITAKEFGYEKCYLETLPYMKAAVKLYEKTGFVALSAPIGDTGHYSCSKWMIKEL